MRKSVHSAAQAHLKALLRAERKKAGLTQQQVAERLEEHQSFVAKYEGDDRRIDVIEFIAIARALSADPSKLLPKLIDKAEI